MLLSGILFCGTASAQRWAVGVDVADMINLGTISIDGAVATGQHITINAETSVNPWTSTRERLTSSRTGSRLIPWA